MGQIAEGCEQEKLREERHVSKILGVMWSWSEATTRKVSTLGTVPEQAGWVAGRLERTGALVAQTQGRTRIHKLVPASGHAAFSRPRQISAAERAVRSREEGFARERRKPPHTLYKVNLVLHCLIRKV